uniref:Ig-like domain-containing protein n=1 Tax=Catharus ustulatus TaxID=91951 RepID=A0A8C3UQ47_CATUS
EPPWMPVMLWDWVTLTCQDTLVLQVPAPTLLEADTVTLRCCGPRNQPVRWVSFYRDGKELGLRVFLFPFYSVAVPETVTVQELFMVPVLEGSPELPEGSPLNLSCLSTPSPLRPPAPRLYRFYQDGQLVGGPQGSPQLLVPAVGVSHSGSYSCEVRSEGGVRIPPSLSGVSLSVQPRRGQVALEDSLELSCTVAMGTGPLSFSGSREGLGAPLETSPHLELQHIGDDDSGHYQCRVSDRDTPPPGLSPVCVPAVPVANATITPGPPALQVHPGDSVTLRCSVQVGSAPVTFTWLHNGHQVAQGPLLELGVIHVGHLGTYQCVATNQLGQDGHRVFRALSPELALEVTPQGTTGHLWNTGGVTRGSHVGLRSPDHR